MINYGLDLSNFQYFWNHLGQKFMLRKFYSTSSKKKMNNSKFQRLWFGFYYREHYKAFMFAWSMYYIM